MNVDNILNLIDTFEFSYSNSNCVTGSMSIKDYDKDNKFLQSIFNGNEETQMDFEVEVSKDSLSHMIIIMNLRITLDGIIYQ